MNIATQRELLRRFFELRAAHTTSLAPAPYRQNAAVYTDPERLASEDGCCSADGRLSRH